MDKKPAGASASNFKTRLMAHPTVLSITGAMISGAGKRVGEDRIDPTGTIQPFFDMTNAHPTGAPFTGGLIGAGAGLLTAVVAQRIQAKKFHQEQNEASRTQTLGRQLRKYPPTK